MWKQEKLEAQIKEVSAIKDHVVISGGLAWHFMSPPHEENKYIHDHKDVDLFVFPERFQEVVQTIKGRGFNKYWTKYSTPGFYRYGYTACEGSKRVKVLYDLFLGTVPYIKIKGFKITDPKYLLTLYKTPEEKNGVHTSGDCYAVKAARILTNRGISPVGRKELLKDTGV